MTSRHLTRLARVATTFAAMFAVAGLVPGQAQAETAAHRAPSASIVAPTMCAAPTPTTAAGFQAMFATVDTREFGAADVGISVKVGGRSVWLWGDTFSEGRFVHSTAITQDRGCLRVSHGGAQLLPNDDAQHIYWIQSATSDRSTPYGKPPSVVITGSGAWDFRDGGFSRTAVTHLDADGDLTFVRWGAPVVSPAPDPGPLYVLGPHHYGYSVQTHPEFRLASGKTLVSMAQNWDDGVLHPFTDYRVLFSER